MQLLVLTAQSGMQCRKSIAVCKAAPVHNWALTVHSLDKVATSKLLFVEFGLQFGNLGH
jgi:hypothetical protein